MIEQILTPQPHRQEGRRDPLQDQGEVIVDPGAPALNPGEGNLGPVNEQGEGNLGPVNEQGEGNLGPVNEQGE